VVAKTLRFGGRCGPAGFFAASHSPSSRDIAAFFSATWRRSVSSSRLIRLASSRKLATGERRSRLAISGMVPGSWCDFSPSKIATGCSIRKRRYRDSSLLEFAVSRLDAQGNGGESLESPKDFKTAQPADRRELTIGIRLEPAEPLRFRNSGP
jgi:hypothetical protein